MELVTALHTVLFCEVGIFFFCFLALCIFGLGEGNVLVIFYFFFFFEQAFVSGCTMKLAEMQ